MANHRVLVSFKNNTRMKDFYNCNINIVSLFSDLEGNVHISEEIEKLTTHKVTDAMSVTGLLII